MNAESAAREMQILEHNLQHAMMQKQTIQVELNEVTNALGELEKSHGEVYRVMANVMMLADKNALEKELEEKKRVLELRVEAVEKQEMLIEAKLLEMKKQKH